MKDETILAVIGVGIILVILVFLFAIWGGNPEGLWWKVERYQKKNEEQIAKLQKQIEKFHWGNEGYITEIPSEEQKEQEQDRNIEVLRTQINQLAPLLKILKDNDAQRRTH